MNGCSGLSSENMKFPAARSTSQKHGIVAKIGRLWISLMYLLNFFSSSFEDKYSAITLLTNIPVFFSNRS